MPSRRHERRHPQMRQLHQPPLVPRLEVRDPALGIKLDLGILPPIEVNIGKPNPPSATQAPSSPPSTSRPTQTNQPTQPTHTPAPQNPQPTQPNQTTPPTQQTQAPAAPSPSSPASSTNASSGTSGSTSAPHSQPSSPTDQPSSGDGNNGSDGTPNGGSSSGGDGEGGEGGEGSAGSGGTVSGGGLNPVTGRPEGSNLGSSDFPDRGGVDGDTSGGDSLSGNGGGSQQGGTGSSGSNSGTTRGRGDRPPTTSTTTGADGKPTVIEIDDGGLPSNDTGSSGGFPKGAAAAIGIICAIFFLLGLVLLLRRHRRAKRDQRAQLWWFSRRRNSKTYKDENTHVVQIPPHSARSSFATTYDHSNAVQFDVNFNASMPALPPMAEIRRSRNDFEYPMPPSTESSHDQRDQRFSVGSAGSGGSGTSRESQFFIINHRPSLESSADHSTNPHAGVSLRSRPSQRFAFPKPPSDVSSDRKSGYSDSSRPESAADDTDRSMKTFATPDTSPTPPEHQNLPALADNPFADPDTGAVPAPQSNISHTTNTTDPFSDSTISMAHGGSVEDAPPVPVMRTFTATLDDEVTVRPGDSVKVHQVFDDGWALVDKLDAESGAPVQRGLCPLACLR